MRLVLTCNGNKHHTYNFPDCVFDPELPINIIDIPTLGAFFGKYDAMPRSDDYGTWVKSSDTKSQFVWDHGKHERHFIHGSSRLPELYLYIGQGYSTASCTRMHRFMAHKVHFAFS